MGAPLAVMLGTLFLVHETQTTINLDEMKATASSLRSALKSRTLWGVMIFLAFWNFSPSFGTPLYSHMIDNLKFSQGFFGWLGVYRALSSILGAWLYRTYLAGRLSTRQLVSLSIVLGTVSTLANLCLVRPNLLEVVVPIGPDGLGLGTGSEVIAVGLTLIFGVGEMIGLLTLLGARLYVDYFDRDLTLLIVISAGFTLSCFLLFPLLRAVFRTSEKEPKVVT